MINAQAMLVPYDPYFCKVTWCWMSFGRALELCQSGYRLQGSWKAGTLAVAAVVFTLCPISQHRPRGEGLVSGRIISASVVLLRAAPLDQC